MSDAGPREDVTEYATWTSAPSTKGPAMGSRTTRTFCDVMVSVGVSEQGTNVRALIEVLRGFPRRT